MGGFGNMLGQIGQGIAEKASYRSPVFRALYNRYLSGRNPLGQNRNAGQVANTAGWTINGQPMGSGGGMPSGTSPVTGGLIQRGPAAGTGGSQSFDGLIQRGPAAGTPGGDIPGPTGPPGGDPMDSEAPAIDEAAAQGTVVTRPTIAKLGEEGPEAVVPLTPRAGNKMQPDLLEGRIAEPRVPGIRYSRYKGANRFGPGAGGPV